jgi:hypothetical protein
VLPHALFVSACSLSCVSENHITDITGKFCLVSGDSRSEKQQIPRSYRVYVVPFSAHHSAGSYLLLLFSSEFVPQRFCRVSFVTLFFAESWSALFVHSTLVSAAASESAESPSEPESLERICWIDFATGDFRTDSLAYVAALQGALDLISSHFKLAPKLIWNKTEFGCKP